MITPTKEQTVIVPDVHGRHFWHRAVPHAKAGGRVIFLGDYIDPYPQEDIDPQEAIGEFKRIIEFAGRFPENVVLLLGNHDLHYFTREPSRMEGGSLDDDNGELIRSLFLDNRHLFTMTFSMEVGDRLWLFSHAGILRGWVRENMPSILSMEGKDRDRALEASRRLNDMWTDFDYGKDRPNFIDRYLAQVSSLRGGGFEFGSPVWADYREFDKETGQRTSFEGVYQVFGHSQQHYGPLMTDSYALLDCRRMFYFEGKDALIRELPKDDCPEHFINPDTSRPPLFKKYSSIENEFNEEFLQKVREEIPSDTLWAVQEKVHGTNVSFICEFLGGGKISMTFAKRTSPVEEGENFYSYEEFVERYRPRIEKLARQVLRRYSYRADGVVVFGEMFGGSYPHPDVKKIGRMSAIQKGVSYSPSHEFYGFDIYLYKNGEGCYLPLEQVNRLFERAGLLHAETLFSGTLDECLKYPNAFQSTIAPKLGLPPLEDNICEGVVIRPLVPLYLRKGDRVIIKSKNARFAERKSHREDKGKKTPEPLSPALQAAIDEAGRLLTEARLDSVTSKIGEVYYPKDLGKVAGLFAKDVLEDIGKLLPSEVATLDKNELKRLNKEVSSMSFSFIKDLKLRRPEERT